MSARWPGLPRSPPGQRGTPPLRPVGPPPAGRTAGVGYAAIWVAVEVRGLDGPDPAEAGSGDLEPHLSVGKGTGACEGSGSWSVL